jgi:hypothetical protein
VYDSAVACFQLIMNTCAIETMDMWAISTNDRGVKTVEWIIHSYVRATQRDAAVLNQHGVAGIHNEKKITPLKIPVLPDPLLEMQDCDSP